MARQKRRDPVLVGPVSVTQVGGAHRVTAEVDGARVWIESPDCELRAAPEVFSSAYLLPALHQGTHLTPVEPLDPVWLANVERLMWVWRDWWGYRVAVPRAPGAPEPPPSRSPVRGADALVPPPAGAALAGSATGSPGGAPRANVALFFSVGVDSFYSLLRCHESPGRLVTVHGFDVVLSDGARMAGVEASLRAVCEACGLRPILVRTNLREHPLMQAAPWGRTHGGALAAVAHALGEGVDEVLISSSVSLSRKHKWGSHWTTDPLFGSSRLSLRELGMELKRLDKLRTLVDEPLVRRHLRVCWENRSPAGNCSRCGKCLMTRLVLHDCGALEDFPVFEGTATLARDLDAYPVNWGFLTQLEAVSKSSRLDPEVLRATQDLLRRSRYAQRRDVMWRRAILKKLLQWTGHRPS